MRGLDGRKGLTGAGTGDVTTAVLPTGLRLVVGRKPGAPATALTMHYPAGWTVDPAPHAGLAHLVEHLMFAGSQRLAPMEHVTLIESRGGLVNATTRPDHVTYHQVLPADELELAIWLEAERLRALRVTQAVLDNERDAVLQEVASNVTHRAYGGFPWLQLPGLLFDSFAHAHHGYGTEESLQRVTVDDVLTFLDLHYRTDRAVLAVVGDVWPVDARRLVETHFSAIPAPRVAAPHRPIVRASGQKRHGVRTDLLAPLPAVALGWRAPSPRTALRDYLAWALLAEVLGGGEDGSLHAALVTERSLAVGVSGYLGHLGDPWSSGDPVLLQLEIYRTPEADWPTVQHLVTTEIDRTAIDGPAPDRLARARARLTLNLWRTWDQPLGRANLLGVRHLLGLPLYAAAALPALLDAVEPDQVRRAAGRQNSCPAAQLEVRTAGDARI